MDTWKDYGREEFSFLTALESFQSAWRVSYPKHKWNPYTWVWCFTTEEIGT